MGDHPKTHCQKGHPLEAPNLVFNTAGNRECRQCRYKRVNANARATRLRERLKREYLRAQAAAAGGPGLPYARKESSQASALSCSGASASTAPG